MTLTMGLLLPLLLLAAVDGSSMIEWPGFPPPRSKEYKRTTLKPPPPPPPARQQQHLQPHGISGVLEVHNRYRAIHGTPSVSWNETLAAYAAEWGEKCLFAHSPPSAYGENIALDSAALATSSGSVMGSIASRWYTYEVGDYNFSDPESGRAGHFTQVVWRSTKVIGCSAVDPSVCPGGIARSTGTMMLICEYYPAGNWRGGFAKNVPPPIT